MHELPATRVLIAGCSCAVLSLLTACASPDPDMLRKRLDASVGRPFDQTAFSRNTAAIRTRLPDEAETQRYIFTWANGCAYLITVNKASGIIAGWRFASSEMLCQAVPHRPLGS